MASLPVLSKASELAEVIQKTLSTEGLVATIFQKGDAFYVTGIQRNLIAGTITPTTINYAVYETPNSVRIIGPDANYQNPGRLLHALALNVEENLAVRDCNVVLKLPPNLMFEQESSPSS